MAWRNTGDHSLRTALALAVSALIALGALTPAQAQTPYWLDAITVLATKLEERAIDSLAAISTVREPQLTQLMPSRTSDIFFGVPSVSFQQRGDDPATAINIRGMQDFGRVAVVVDGARQNFQRTGHNADGLFYLDPELIGGADIVRGPVANIYGTGALGGVVSFRTKDVEDILKPGQSWGVLTHGEIGSNLFRATGSIFAAVRPSPNVDLLFGGSIAHRSNYRDGNGFEWPNTSSDTSSLLAKAAFRPVEGHEVKLTALRSQFDYLSGIPVAPTTSIYDARVLSQIATAGWRYAKPEDRIFDFDAKVYWTRTESDLTKIAGSNNAATGIVGATRSFNIDTVGFDVHNTTRFDAGPLRNAVTYGVDYFRDSVNVNDPTGTGDLFTPSGERTVSGGFVQLKSNFSMLEVITAARYDAYSLNAPGFTTDGSRISPKVTVGITPIAGVTPYATYAEGYRAPAVTETLVSGQHPNFGPGSNFIFLSNVALRPEVGKTMEVGVNLKFDNVFRPGDAFRAKLNAFRNDVSDFIEQVRVESFTPGQGGILCPNPSFAAACIQYQNLTQARIEGIEFESFYDAGDWFAGLSGQHLRGRNAVTGVPLLKIQPDQVAITLGARLMERKVTVALRWLAVAAKTASEIPTSDPDGPGPAPAIPSLPPTGSYNLFNVYIGYQPNENMVVGLSVENLLNQHYARYTDVFPGTGQTLLPFPSPGITIKGSLRVRFGPDFALAADPAKAVR